MRENYDYLLIRAQSDMSPGLGSQLAELRRSVTGSGGTVVGSWLGAGSIGWFDDEAVVLVGWPGRRPDPAGWSAPLDDAAGAEVIAMQATARPASPGVVRTGGVHAHRWLDVEPGHEDEVVDLSAGAWPAFESSFDAHIEGLFRVEDGAGPMLLVTWYASVAEWERSRGVAGPDQGALAEAQDNFRRRRQLTRRRVVRLARPMS